MTLIGIPVEKGVGKACTSPAKGENFDDPEEVTTPFRVRHGTGSSLDGALASDLSSEERAPDTRPVSSRTIAWRLRYVFVLAWLTTLQYGSLGPSLMYLSQSFFAGSGADCEAHPSSDICKKGAVDLAFWSGISRGASHSVAWLLALSMGSWSDTLGRRPIFRAKASASIVPIVMLALHVCFGVSLWLYLVAGPIYEAFDINGVFLAFMSDVIQEPHARAQAFGVLIIGWFGGAFVVLPLAAFLPTGIAVVISLATAVVKLVYMFTVFPETSQAAVAAACDGKSRPAPPNLFNVAREAARVFCRHSFIIRMALVLVLSGLSLAGLGTVATPILTGYLGMEKKAITGLLVVIGVSVVISMVCLMPPLVRCAGEVRALQACLAVSAVFPVLFPLCATPVHVAILSGILGGPMCLQFPIISAIKSNLVSQEEQGLVQGALAAARVVATALADVFFGWFFHYATAGGTLPRSSTFVPLGGVALLAVVAFLLALSLPSKPPPPPDAARPPVSEGAVELGAGSGKPVDANEVELSVCADPL